MNILGKNYVAIFLAATLVTGIFSVIFPSFNDVEASGDRHNDKRHGDKSKSVIVKKFVCNQNNIDVGGVGIDIQPNDIVSTLAGAQAQEEGNQELSANQMGNNEGPNGERNQGSQHDSKGIVFICINNGNGGNGGNGPPNGVGDCDRCFLPTNVPDGIIPPGLLTMLNTYLANNPPESIDNVGELCEFIERVAGTNLEVTEQQIRTLLNAALPGESAPPVIQAIIECLLEENLITPSSPS